MYFVDTLNKCKVSNLFSNKMIIVFIQLHNYFNAPNLSLLFAFFFFGSIWNLLNYTDIYIFGFKFSSTIYLVGSIQYFKSTFSIANHRIQPLLCNSFTCLFDGKRKFNSTIEDNFIVVRLNDIPEYWNQYDLWNGIVKLHRSESIFLRFSYIFCCWYGSSFRNL